MTVDSPAPTDALTLLHRDGQLAERYPEVRGLVEDLVSQDSDGTALRRAGAQLARLNPDDVLAHHPDTTTTTVAFTGHGTLGPLVPALTAETARHGVLLRPVVGDHDGWVFELPDPAGVVHAAQPDVTVCVLDPHVVAGEFPVPWTVEDATAVLDAKIRLVEDLVARFHALTTATLVMNTLPLPGAISSQLLDRRSRARLGAAWREANARLLRLSGGATVVVDFDPLVAEGLPVTDPRLATYTSLHLSPGLLTRYARELGHLVRHATGRVRKCLALDLDGTVWGGVLGDDGAEGIEVADGYRGEAFTAFQRLVKQMAAQGVLLTATSKNDDGPVRTVLRDHPRMTLREDDFVRIAANWGPKHENIRALAEDLGIGIDSVVFADDSPFERGLVRRELPDVSVVDLDDEPALHPAALLRDGWFTVPELTTEDRRRPASYREELGRRDFLAGFSSTEDYLAELGVVVELREIRQADDPEIARVAQLTMRTNQFNLTTLRLGEPEVVARVADEHGRVVVVHTRDRFGDNGLVGALFLHEDRERAVLENFVLSCRVFSRGVEQATLAALLRNTRDRGVRVLSAEYRPTAKNGKVRDLYPRHGFAVVAEDADRAGFRHDLGELPTTPPHVRLVDRLGHTPERSGR